MTVRPTLDLESLVGIFKLASGPTRLRLLALLDCCDLTVTDLSEIIGQSQPRISRHLKLLSNARLLDRRQEGPWAYLRLKRTGTGALLVRELLDHASPDDPVMARDRERLLARSRPAAMPAGALRRSAS